MLQWSDDRYKIFILSAVKHTFTVMFGSPGTKVLSSVPEYNLEFQGNVQNLQKRPLFMKFYPEMP